MDDLNQIESHRSRWEVTAQSSRVREARSEVGADVAPLYTPEDLEDIDYLRDIGFPGEFPFTRGIYPLMYRDRLWGIRQYSGFGSPEDTNERWKKLARTGRLLGVSLALDLPTQLGYDSDDPSIADEVGRVGCAVDSLRDLEALFDGIPLDRTPVTIVQSTHALFFLAGLIAVAKKQGVDQSKLSGTMSNCTLLEYACRGNWLFPPAPSMRSAVDVVDHCLGHMPSYFPFNFFGCNLRSAGANMVQEIGYTFAITIAYIDEALKRNIDVDEIAPKISFLFSSGVRMLEETAKLRAARRAWARLITERYKAVKDTSKMLRMTVWPLAFELSAVEPELNLVRTACGVAAGALSGAQTIFSPSIDENFAIPTEKTARWALRTNQIIAEESDVSKTIDPLGGSYFIEAMTSQYERAINQAVQEIESVGGAVRAIETGYIQRKLADNAYRQEIDTETGKRVLVGFNKYRADDAVEEPIAVQRIDPGSVARQIERVRQVKETRDDGAVRGALDRVRKVAQGNENLVPAVLGAVEAYATIAEVTAALRSGWGVFKEPADC